MKGNHTKKFINKYTKPPTFFVLLKFAEMAFG